MIWQQKMSYPKSVDPDIRALLDQAEVLIPVPDSGDRYCDLMDWVRDLEKLLTEKEMAVVMSNLGPNM